MYIIEFYSALAMQAELYNVNNIYAQRLLVRTYTASMTVHECF